MADLHPLVVLAQRLAEGRRQHPSNAAFGCPGRPSVLCYRTPMKPGWIWLAVLLLWAAMIAAVVWFLRGG